MENEVLKQKQKSKRFNLLKSVVEIEKLIPHLPQDGECYKFISSGNFSSISFVKYIADRTPIRFLFASTLRVGRKHLWILDELRRVGKLEKCFFVVGNIMKNDSEKGKSYKYYDDLERVCEENSWDLVVKNNHSKILLFDTDDGKFVLETSSNLNDNPNTEQFSLEKDEELFDFYLKAFGGDHYGEQGEDD